MYHAGSSYARRATQNFTVKMNVKGSFEIWFGELQIYNESVTPIFDRKPNAPIYIMFIYSTTYWPLQPSSAWVLQEIKL